MTAYVIGMVMNEDFSVKWSRYNDETDEKYMLKYRFQNNQILIVKYNLLFSSMLSVSSFNFS